MYESEVNSKVETAGGIPEAVLNKFTATRNEVSEKSLLPWTEHCIECVWPTCYTSCSLYSPRKDGKCQRFENGMVRIDLKNGGYLIRITFKKWGKLLAEGAHDLYPLKQADKEEVRDQRIGKIVQAVPLPSSVKKRVIQKRYGIKNRSAHSSFDHGNFSPDAFIMEVYNPSEQAVNGTLTFRPYGELGKMPHQELTSFPPGYHRFELPAEKLGINTDQPFKAEWTPNDIPEGGTLYFGMMDFIIWKKKPESVTRPKVKCIIWDLDNTVWKGTLIEDGPDGIQLREGIREVMTKLDQGGILQSAASKNNREEALEALEKFGLSEYLLMPQIHWGPKSESIRSIVSGLNIGMDTVVFIDDQIFEREEVRTAHPAIRTWDINDFDPPEMILQNVELKDTKEARNRRKMYQQEIERIESSESFGGDYFDFLRSCSLSITIDTVTDENFNRVHELIQRTNQMNFSGNRYSEEEIRKITDDPQLRTYVLSVSDKFGDYGIVGFGIFDESSLVLKDLTFSCRIQSKRVEHAFLFWLITTIHNEFGRYPGVVYNKTDRNAASGKVFDDFGFRPVSDKPGWLYLPEDSAPPDDGLIKIVKKA